MGVQAVSNQRDGGVLRSDERGRNPGELRSLPCQHPILINEISKYFQNGWRQDETSKDPSVEVGHSHPYPYHSLPKFFTSKKRGDDVF
jgi:hypothetical protein